MKKKILYSETCRTGGPLTRSRGMQILACAGLIKEVGGLLKEICPNRRILLLTDSNTDRLYAQGVAGALEAWGFGVRRHVLRPGEEEKTLGALQGIYQALADFPIRSQDLLLCLGGSTVCDLGTVAAATYLGGLDYVLVPTSLGAQAGRGILGRAGINFPQGKDLIYVCHQPFLTLIDPRLLRTLSRETMADGMAEIIRLAAVGESRIFRCLEDMGGLDALLGRLTLGEEEELAELLWCCAQFCHQLAEKDPRGEGAARILEFGQPLARAIETCWQYCCGGKALAVGMAAITVFSETRRLTERGTAGRLKVLLHRFGLPDQLGDLCCSEAVGTGRLQGETAGPAQEGKAGGSFGSFGSFASLQMAAGPRRPVAPGGLQGPGLAAALQEAAGLDRNIFNGRMQLIYLTRVGTAGIYRTPLETLPWRELAEGLF